MKVKFYHLLFVLLLLSSPTFILNTHAAKDDVRATITDSTFLIVQTQQGKLRGTTERNVCVWRGIQYAKTTEGDLRFRAPQPVEKWDGIKDALAYGAVAPQEDNRFLEGNPQSENCLSLNIWSPAADNKKRPVMVWIHGGGFTVGAGSSSLYNGANLSGNGNVVVVTINYRLGTLGFLYFDDSLALQNGFENNLGIKDQIAALKWVKENIGAFGGDPEQVTIFGESAGGTSVQTLLATPSAKGLFKGAIAESGPAALVWNKKTAHEFTQKYLNILGISDYKLLKSIPVDTLMKAQDELIKYMIKNTPHKVFAPTIDGDLLPHDIFTGVNSGQAANVTLMLGTNKDESSVFAKRSLRMAPANAKELDKEFLSRLKPEDQKRVTSAYGKYPHKRAVLDLLTDAVFRIPVVRLAEHHSKHAPVYMYRFEWTSFLLNVSGYRSFHGLEIPFVFGNSDGRFGRILKTIATKKLIKRLSGEMQTAWINFARYGNPNGNTAGEWKPFNKEERTTMIFDSNSAPINDPDSQQRKAWEGVSYY